LRKLSPTSPCAPEPMLRSGCRSITHAVRPGRRGPRPRAWSPSTRAERVRRRPRPAPHRDLAAPLAQVELRGERLVDAGERRAGVEHEVERAPRR
jgi:hypothetical protein